MALLATEKAFASTRLTEAIRAISLTDYREFSVGDPQLDEYVERLKESADHCQKCPALLPPNAKFCPECGEPVEVRSIISGLLDEPVSSLSISDRLIRRVEPHFAKGRHRHGGRVS